MARSDSPRAGASIAAGTRLEARLAGAGFAGRIPNTRAANLHAIDRLLAGDPFYTFSIAAIDRALCRGKLAREHVLETMARVCGCEDVDAFLADPGFIAPRASAAGLASMAAGLADAASRRLTVALGTGHPGSMLGCYVRLADWLRERGCRIAPVPARHPAGVDWWADEIGGVAVTSDGCGILHGHSTRVMAAVLAGSPVDLTIADHGHAGAAINAGIPCLAVMDTNDPALAVAGSLGSPGLVVVPLYDNLPNAVTRELAEWLIEMAR